MVSKEARMWTTNFYNSFFYKYFVEHEQWAVENSLITYVCYAPELFILVESVYLTEQTSPD